MQPAATFRQKLDFVLEENRVYRALLDRHSPSWRLEDSERKTLAEKGKPGVMTGLPGHWLISVTPFRIRQSETFFAHTAWDRPRSGDDTPHGLNSSGDTKMFSGRRISSQRKFGPRAG